MAEGRGALIDWLQLMRPAQWSKNLLLFAALLFSGLLFDAEAFLTVCGAFACFCMVASGAYIMNDVRDCERDRQHPSKRLRPLPAGRVARGPAIGLSILLMVMAIAGAATLGFPFGVLTVAYLLLQVAYTFSLKDVVILDVMAIASGFVLRAVGGGLVIGVPISPWLIICTFLLALFPRYVVTPNLDFAYQASTDVEFHRILCEADLVLCDGMPLVWASRWLGADVGERVAGSDLLLPLLERSAARGFRIFFLGSSQEVLEQARGHCEVRLPGIRICGMHAPPHAPLLALGHEEIRRRLRAARPDLLLVALGTPKGEKLISMISRDAGVPCSIGVGAGLDFLAGRFPRAPELWKRTGGEWLFRLLLEPRRLAGRYFRDAAFFLPTIAAQLRQSREGGGPGPSPSPPVEESSGTGSWSRLEGRVDAAAARSGAVELPGTPGEVMVLSLEGVTSVDAVSLGALLRAWKRCRDHDGDLVLYRPSARVRQTLRTLGLDRVFRIAESPEQARRLRALSPSRPHIEVRDGPGRTLVSSIAGELTVRGAGYSRDTLLGMWEEHPEAESMVLHVRELSYMDSAGLALLLEIEETVRQRGGGRLTVVDAGPSVREVITRGQSGALLGTHAPGD